MESENTHDVLIQELENCTQRGFVINVLFVYWFRSFIHCTPIGLATKAPRRPDSWKAISNSSIQESKCKFLYTESLFIESKF